MTDSTVQFGDCIKLMGQLQPESIDLIVTDPPEQASPLWLDVAYRVLKTGRACYVLGTESTMQKFKPRKFEFIEMITWKHPETPIYKWTPIFVLSKGEPEVGLPVFDEWNYRAVPMDKRITPAQKPVELIERMISLSSNPGETVLDPFLGTGTTAVACKRLHRNCIGMEIDSRRVMISRERVAKVIA
jgi:hypothetical protein